MSAQISLVKITEDEFNIWIVENKNGYRDENIKNGLTFAEAQKKADEDIARLLGEGYKTPDQHIFSIRENSNNWIGTIWFAVRGAADNRKAFIFDIVLKEETRGKGYGKKTMELLEVEVKKLGLRHIGLHVFGHNTVARNLYEKMGYGVTNLVLEKVL